MLLLFDPLDQSFPAALCSVVLTDNFPCDSIKPWEFAPGALASTPPSNKKDFSDHLLSVGVPNPASSEGEDAIAILVPKVLQPITVG